MNDFKMHDFANELEVFDFLLHRSVCMSVSAHPSVPFSVLPPVHLSICSYVLCLFLGPSVRLSYVFSLVRPSSVLCLFLGPSVRLSYVCSLVRPSVCLMSVPWSVLSRCPSVSLFNGYLAFTLGHIEVGLKHDEGNFRVSESYISTTN